MVYGLLLVVHVLVALFLVGVILLQGGRGGLGEAMGGAAAQSLFGGGANTVMTKITAVAAGLFMATCLSLAKLSSAGGRSVVDRMPAAPAALPLTFPQAPEEPAAATAPSGREETPHPVTTAPSPATPTPAAEKTDTAP